MRQTVVRRKDANYDIKKRKGMQTPDSALRKASFGKIIALTLAAEMDIFSGTTESSRLGNDFSRRVHADHVQDGQSLVRTHTGFSLPEEHTGQRRPGRE
jgi:hypothetical protein